MTFDLNFFKSALSQEVPSFENPKRIWTDTRSLKPGDLFVAIKGENFDGHHFINKAAEAGAVAALVHKGSAENSPIPLIEVNDTIEAIRLLAKKHRETIKAQVIAVAGSNGKTTTKEWMAHLFSAHYGESNVFKTKKSQNSILGIAMSLLQIREEDYAIVEIGIDEPGWMAKHLEVVQPDAGVVTNIAEEHLAGFGSIDIIEKEEGLLLDYLDQHRSLYALNADDERLKKRTPSNKTLTYGLKNRADVEGLYKRPNILNCFGEDWISTLPGEHNAMNLLASICVFQLFSKNIQKEDLKKLAESCKSFQGEDHRGQWIVNKTKISIFDDCYNANPKSVLTSLSTYLELSEGLSRGIVLGDMLDLGKTSEEAHRQILNRIKVLDFDQIYLFGDEFKKLKPSCSEENIHFFGGDFEKMNQALKQDLKTKKFDCLMLKGSRGMKLERLLKLFE